MDEIYAANSLAFDPAGDRLYAGYKAEIRQFELARPGREVSKLSTGSRKEGGQRNLISCMALNPDMSGLLAAGCYDNTVGLYATHEGVNVLSVFPAQHGGVTQVKFSPDGKFLFTAARKDNNIYCWDIRATGQVLRTFTREANTNQRIAFDVDPTGKWITTGGVNGDVLIYDVQTGGLVQSWRPHQDGTNGVSFHPSEPLVATSSGQRQIEDAMTDSSDDEDDDAVGAGGEAVPGARPNEVAVHRVRAPAQAGV